MKKKLLMAKRCVAALRQQKKMFLLLLVLSVVFAFTEGLGLSLIFPLLELATKEGSISSGIPFLRDVAAGLKTFEPARQLLVVCVALVVVTLLRSLLQLLISALNSWVSLKIREQLILESFDGVLRVELGHFNKGKRGDQINSVFSHPQDVSALLRSFGEFLQHIVTMSILAVMMFITSWYGTLIVLSLLAVMSTAIRRTLQKTLQSSGELVVNTRSVVHQSLYETMGGLSTIKLLTAEDGTIRDMTRNMSKYTKHQFRFMVLSSIGYPIMSFGAAVVLVGCILVGQEYYGSTPSEWLGPFIVLIVVMSRFVGPFSSANVALNNIIARYPALVAYDEMLQGNREHEEKSGEILLSSFQESVCFDAVSFSHGEKSVLDQLSFSVSKGEFVAIVGPSGAGKSTVIKLLAGLYLPFAGAVRVDGVSIAELDRDCWRRKLSFVMQDTFVFDDSLRRNVVLDNLGVSDSRILQEAALVGLREYIEELPEGLDTRLGDNGLNMSGGQKQRLALLRALVADRDILVLDEPTSNLDSLSEAVIQTTLESLKGRKTIIVVAHRLSTISKADKIIVMNGGRLEAAGKHDNLKRSSDTYAKMVKLQS